MKNGELKIEKGIPLPPARGGRRSETAALMRAMKKGDSILMHKAPTNVQQHALRYIGKGKFATRREGNGYRVWKTA